MHISGIPGSKAWIILVTGKFVWRKNMFLNTTRGYISALEHEQINEDQTLFHRAVFLKAV